MTLKLKILGNKVPIPKHPDLAELEVVPHNWPDADCEVNIVCEEFTSMCPVTEQPDFATIEISYAPRNHLIESKALKLYLNSFRHHGVFAEDITVRICTDLARALKPKWLEVRGNFRSRGGIKLMPVVRYKGGPVPKKRISKKG